MVRISKLRRKIIFVAVLSGLLACTNGTLVSTTQWQVSNYGTGIDGDQAISSTITTSATYSDSQGRTRSYGGNFRTIAVDGTRLIFSAPAPINSLDFMVGDEVMWIIIGAGTSSPCFTMIGMYGFNHVVSITGSNMSVDSQLPGGIIPDNNVANTPGYCLMEIVRIPNFSNVTITAGSLQAQNFNYAAGSGGILPLRVSGTLSLSGAGKVMADGSGFANGTAGNQGDGINRMGIGSSASNANGGGGNSAASSGGGGGGNYLIGGNGALGASGGNLLNLCSGPCMPDQKAFLGGGGGGGNLSNGGSGGGTVFIYAKSIIGSGSITSNGGTGAGAYGGGGSGGTILLTSINASGFTGNINVSGGNGAAGGGGGAGGIAKAITCNPGFGGTFGITGGTGSNLGGNGYGTAMTTQQACSN